MAQSGDKLLAEKGGDLSVDESGPHRTVRETEKYKIDLDRLLELQRFNLPVGGNHNNVRFAINVALLPQADDLVQYEAAIPGAAGYIMKAADEERAHRHALERLVVEEAEKRRHFGLRTNFSLSSLGLIGAAVVGIWGHPWVGGILAVVAIGGPLAAQTLAMTLARSNPPPSHARSVTETVRQRRGAESGER